MTVRRAESDEMRLLVVEDDPTISEPLREGLIREGFDVDIAATGADALRASLADLVLLDLGLLTWRGALSARNCGPGAVCRSSSSPPRR